MHLGGFCSNSNFNFSVPGTIIVGGEEVEPVAYGDFEQSIYTIGGASVNETDFFGNGTGLPGAYNSANHTENGIVWLAGGTYTVNLKPAVFAGLENGFTVLIDITGVSGFPAGFTATDGTEFSPYFDAYVKAFPSKIGIGENEASIDTNKDFVPGETRRRVAASYSATVMKASIDGGGVLVAADPNETWAGDLDEMCLYVGADAAIRIHRFAIYELQDNDEALVVLSDTGKPGRITYPVVSGTAQVGQTLSCSTGTWSNTPTSYSYEWRGAVVDPYPTGNTLLLTEDWQDAEPYCYVTATNATGSAIALSNSVGPVIAA